MSADEDLLTAADTASARDRLAAALRTTINFIMAAEFEDEAVVHAAQCVEELNVRLAKAGTVASIASFDAETFFGGNFRKLTSPITGLWNPLAPPIRIQEIEGADGGPHEVLGHVMFDRAYEGVPNCVHGGVIAQTLDELLGAANQAAGTVGMTGTMTVRYLRPTPSRTDLRLEARCLRREGRKLFPWAGIYHGDNLTAEAEGLFIQVTPEQFLAIARG